MPKKISQATHRRVATTSRPRASTAQKVPARSHAKHIIRSKRSWTKRLIMHPSMTFAMLVVGVFLAGLTYRVAAVDYTVNAVVEASALQSGAIILSPEDDKTVTTRPIIVSGQCPNESYVKLTRNGMFSGAAICSGNLFQIETDLFIGINALQAQAYNITDQPGPITPIVHVTYNPSAGSQAVANDIGLDTSSQYIPPTSLTAPKTDPSKLPLLLTSDYRFNVATTSDLFEWTLQYHSGRAPYKTHVDWGDDKTTSMSVVSTEEFTISHRYAKSGYYPIIVTGEDADGRTVSLQVLALIKNPGDPATRGSILSPPPSSNAAQVGGVYQWLVYAWPTYIVVGTMVMSFWLGERREYLEIMKIPRFYHRLHHR